MNNRQKNLEQVFSEALLIVSLAVAISLFSFITEENKLTGFATLNQEIAADDLFEFDDVHYLGYLPTGNYYIDEKGIVYWADKESKPIARIKFIEEPQKKMHVYVDEIGRVGYALEPILI
ncbi:hypothetical protein HYX02_04290 [Candidatus Woesearchaeota archaeon]|nr:hypothetical protein [Candidatus Woesearchaeota archaeon]